MRGRQVQQYRRVAFYQGPGFPEVSNGFGVAAAGQKDASEAVMSKFVQWFQIESRYEESFRFRLVAGLPVVEGEILMRVSQFGIELDSSSIMLVGLGNAIEFGEGNAE